MIHFEESTHTYTIDGREIPSVTTVCRFLSYDQKSDRPWLAQIAADRGSRVHAACAALDFGQEPEDTLDIDGCLKAYRRFLADHRPDWEGIEYTTASEALGLAGTIDRFGTLYDGRTCILDIKTRTQLHDAPLRAQLTGYRILLEPRHPCEHLYALQLSKDGTYHLREVQEDKPLLDACIFIHHAIRRKSNHVN